MLSAVGIFRLGAYAEAEVQRSEGIPFPVSIPGALVLRFPGPGSKTFPFHAVIPTQTLF